ncbi:ankyrin repeat domain-containing protein [Beggiatoa leptomitoformis]|uniref:Uncharacterized protein n=1 Tax=Beggiatoa leptomitoformis TaxID=288004 RepID=A0A2N9YDW3_9GAMM|nr:ankyrin repeat domain-containing protein [Beggiatoa leptomitoformis]AUI68678.1 hypothetical protein BLE401_08160 [Beggiatoa leptomitoformis]QGX03811.1 hypothetical protein AL038_19445 [Beggiatoa leptomitoformis]
MDWTVISTSGYIVGMQKLLTAGFDINTQDTRGNTPLHYACGWGLKDSERQAKRFGIPLNQMEIEHADFVVFLLKNGANPNIHNKQQETPLMSAIYHGRIATIKHLLNSGANVNFQTDSGYTPLMLATYHCYQDIVQLLLDFGADSSVKKTVNSYGATMDVTQYQCKTK